MILFINFSVFLLIADLTSLKTEVLKTDPAKPTTLQT